MNEIAQTYTFAPAFREMTSLVIGVDGPSGSGKTLSALMIARGLAGGDDSKIGVIDTESGRALHYAPARGEKPSATRFAFRHMDLRPPFKPEAYMAAIDAAETAGVSVIMIDSGSHEWEGEGGLHDVHDEVVAEAVERQRQRAVEQNWKNFDETAASDKASVGAWREPKGRHRKFVSRLLRCRAHLVICFRSDEKLRMEQIEEEGANGKKYKKTVITQAKDLPIDERWVPICEKRLPYEMTVSFLVTPAAPGVPIPRKLQAQHRHAFAEWIDADSGKRGFEQVTEATGRALAAWAMGGDPPDAAKDAEKAAKQGVDAFRKHWGGLSKGARAALKPDLERYQKIAKNADAASDDDLPDDPFATAGNPATETQDSGAPQRPAPDNEGAEASSPSSTASAPSTDPLADLTAEGDARASVGLKAVEAWIAGLTPEEFELVKAKQKGWRATALKADAARAAA